MGKFRLLCLIILSAFLSGETVWAGDFERSSAIYNKGRKKPEALFRSISISKVDEPFIESKIKGMKELPEVKVKNNQFHFVSENNTYHVEVLEQKRHVFSVNGRSVTIPPLWTLAQKYKAAESVFEMKKIGLREIFFPSAHALILNPTGIAAATVTCIAGVGALLAMRTKTVTIDKICEYVQETLPAASGIQSYFAIRGQIKSVKKTIELFSEFTEECNAVNEDVSADHHNQCLELAKDFKCASDRLNPFFKALEAAGEGADSLKRESLPLKEVVAKFETETYPHLMKTSASAPIDENVDAGN